MRYRVEKRIALSGRTAAGQRVASVGAVWELVGTYKRRAVAETVAKRVRTDEHVNPVRVVERP